MNYKIIRSKRKTISIVIKSDCSIEIRSPKNAPEKVIDSFVQKKKYWIEKTIKKQENLIVFPELSEDNLKKIKNITADKIENYLQEFPGKLPSEIVVRKLNSSWGNCNSKGKITINSIVSLLPFVLFEYIMIHELCHLEYLDHSRDFWKLVSYYLPKYKKLKNELKLYKIK